MRPPESTTAPVFQAIDPIILDNEMEGLYQENDMDFLTSHEFQLPGSDVGHEFDELFSRNTTSQLISDEVAEPPSTLSMRKKKRPLPDNTTLKPQSLLAVDPPSDSPENSSPGSSSESVRDHGRQHSIASTNSAVHSENAALAGQFQSNGWFHSGQDETLFGLDTDLHSLGRNFSLDTDIESSNKVMDSAFDFESAASSPSALKLDPNAHSRPRKMLNPLRSPSDGNYHFSQSKVHDSISSSGSPFHSKSSRESSPMATMLPNGRSAQPQWNSRSPSSGMEETFGGIAMAGASPLASTLSPSLSFGHNAMPFGTPDWSTDKVAQISDFGSPSNKPSPRAPGLPVLMVHPTSLKSRVETQIPIRLTLYPLPDGARKVRLPTHTISKPKFLAKSDVTRSPDTLELHTSLVCTSAMQDQTKLKRAFARARGEPMSRRASVTAGAETAQVEDDKPLDGGEVRICSGCIQRERKRASRKKQRKPDEDELFQKDEEKRVIVFNTNEIKEWTEPSKTSLPGQTDSVSPSIPSGAMQVELPMRIACYCRHQNEKLGFQVIFTVKDHLDNVIAQAITNSIMITDDHKTHAPPAPAPNPTSALPDGTQLPGAGVFASGPSGEGSHSSTIAPQPFRSSHSTTDLQGLQQHYASQQFPMTPGAYAIPHSNGTSGSASTSTSHTPRNLSRHASPSENSGPSSKRRKHSSSGKIPTGLTMTRLEGTQPSPMVNNSAASGGNQLSSSRFTAPVERPFVSPTSMSGHFTNGPPTPNSNDNANPFFNPGLQSTGLDGLAQSQLMSAPGSAHPSRPGTPGGTSRNTFQDQSSTMNLGPTPTSQIWPQLTNAGNRLPAVIHKLVPGEGSTTGGTEVTLLGNGFYPGMEVVFGDTLATTTTFWGEKCLNCLTPPALQPGLVPVVFKHEHPTFSPMQPQTQPILPKQQLYFRYVDDRELQMYRLALGILGQKLRNPSDAFQTAQRIMGGDQNTLWNLQNDLQGGSNGQRQVPGFNAQGQMSDLDSRMLTYLEFIDLDESPRAPRYNSRSAAGQTLLHFASSLGLTRFVAGLLARGANPEVQDKNGHTPMHLAALSGHAHIVHRLRLAGANAIARSVRGFTPADLATSLPAHQAALIPARHYRSRSVGSTPSVRRRPSSSVSLNSLWDASSISGSFDQILDSDDSEEEDTDSEDLYISSRRSSIHQDADAALYFARSRQGSAQLDGIQTPVERDIVVEEARSFSPPAALVAWRNQLATQIHQFQQSVGRAFPNLPALPQLPPMPALPDYQAYPMMRRISNLVPHRPSSSRSTREGWWDLITGNSGASTSEPPPYEELYPHKETDEDLELKKTSLVRAAADAAADLHFEAEAGSSREPQIREQLRDIRIGRKLISREEQEQLRQQQAQKMKGLRSDRNLYFFWIPVLLLVLCAWLRNFIPGIGDGASQALEFVKTRYTNRAVEVGV